MWNSHLNKILQGNISSPLLWDCTANCLYTNALFSSIIWCWHKPRSIYIPCKLRLKLWYYYSWYKIVYLKYIGFYIQYHCRIQATSTQQRQCSSRLQYSTYSHAGRFILGNCKLVTWVSSSTMTGGPALQTGRSRVPFQMGSMGFFIGLILPVTPWPTQPLSTRDISWGVKTRGA